MISLRPAEQADCERLFDWRTLPAVAVNMYGPPPQTLDAHGEWFRRVVNHPGLRYWVVMHNATPIGLGYIEEWDQQNARATWGMYIADEHARTLGLGAAAAFCIIDRAFAELRLHKLCGEVLTFNTAALALQRRLGFTRDGVLRAHLFRDGVWHDAALFSILEDEWKAQRRVLEPLVNKMQQW